MDDKKSTYIGTRRCFKQWMQQNVNKKRWKRQTPGIAHSPQSFLLMDTNCRIGRLESEWLILDPLTSTFHLPNSYRHIMLSKHFESFIYYVIKHWRGWKISGLIRCVQWRKRYLVTMGSAAWLGPHRPSKPLPLNPVRPWGFLKGMKHKCANLITMCLRKTNLRNMPVVSPIKSLGFRTCRPTIIISDVIVHWFQV